MANIKELEGGRAAFAYKCVDIKGKALGKDYKSHVKNIPMMIKTNGLGATFAFVKSKKKPTYDLIYKQTHEWLKDCLTTKHFFVHNNNDLVQKIIELDSNSYRAVTIEVLALFNWLKRFADGLIDKD
jgi:CRISPR-associated protein Cmr5